MPAESKKQQRFFGMVHAVQRGELSPSKVGPKVRKAAQDTDYSVAKDMAETKHKGLPLEKKASPLSSVSPLKKWAIGGAALGGAGGGTLRYFEKHKSKKERATNTIQGAVGGAALGLYVALGGFLRKNIGPSYNRVNYATSYKSDLKTLKLKRKVKTKKEVTDHWKKRMTQIHPDKNLGKDTTKAAQQANEAYSRLKKSQWFYKLAKVNLIGERMKYFEKVGEGASWSEKQKSAFSVMSAGDEGIKKYVVNKDLFKARIKGMLSGKGTYGADKKYLADKGIKMSRLGLKLDFNEEAKKKYLKK